MALQPPTPATRGVVVAATDLPAGRSLVAGDLAVAQVPAGVLPAGTSSDPGDFLGRALAAPMSRGEAMAGHRLTDLPAMGSAPGHDAPAGSVRRCWGCRSALAAGQRVDVVAASGPGLDGAAPFASAELVARTSSCWRSSPRIRGRAASSAVRPPTEDQSPLVLLAADRGAALAIAGAQGRASLGYLMHLGPG